MTNLLTRVPKAAQSAVATLVRSIFLQPDPEAVWSQHEQVTHRYMRLGAITSVWSRIEPTAALPAKEVQLAVTA